MDKKKFDAIMQDPSKFSQQDRKEFVKIALMKLDLIAEKEKVGNKDNVFSLQAKTLV